MKTKTLILFLCFWLGGQFFIIAQKPTLTVRFDFGRYELKPQEKQKLAGLHISPNSTVIVIGEADGVGEELYNLQLALNRAEVVGNFLAKKYPNVIISSKGEINSANNVKDPNHWVAKIYVTGKTLAYSNNIGETSESIFMAECDSSKKLDNCRYICYRNGDSTLYINSDTNCINNFLMVDFQQNRVFKKDLIQLKKNNLNFWQKLLDFLGINKLDTVSKRDTVYKIYYTAQGRKPKNLKFSSTIVFASWGVIDDLYGKKFIDDGVDVKSKEKQTSFIPYTFVLSYYDDKVQLNESLLKIPKRLPYTKETNTEIKLRHVVDKNGKEIMDTTLFPYTTSDNKFYYFNVFRPGKYYIDLLQKFSTKARYKFFNDDYITIWGDSLNIKNNSALNNLECSKIYEWDILPENHIVRYAFEVKNYSGKIHILLDTNFVKKFNDYYFYIYKNNKWICDTSSVQTDFIKDGDKTKYHFVMDMNGVDFFIFAKVYTDIENSAGIVMSKKLQEIENFDTPKYISAILYNNVVCIKPYQFNGGFLFPKQMIYDTATTIIFKQEHSKKNLSEGEYQLRLSDLKTKNNELFYLFYSDLKYNKKIK